MYVDSNCFLGSGGRVASGGLPWVADRRKSRQSGRPASRRGHQQPRSRTGHVSARGRMHDTSPGLGIGDVVVRHVELGGQRTLVPITAPLSSCAYRGHGPTSNTLSPVPACSSIKICTALEQPRRKPGASAASCCPCCAPRHLPDAGACRAVVDCRLADASAAPRPGQAAQNHSRRSRLCQNDRCSILSEQAATVLEPSAGAVYALKMHMQLWKRHRCCRRSKPITTLR